MSKATETLTDFLLVRIAEDEAMAQAATAGPWVSRPEMGDACPGDWAWEVLGADGEHLFTAELGNTTGEATQEDSQHIARHDPARILAECEAKRRIVEFHDSRPVLVETGPVVEQADPTDVASRITWVTEREHRDRFGTEPPPAPMLLALAAVYAEHPDYDEAWRPVGTVLG